MKMKPSLLENDFFKSHMDMKSKFQYINQSLTYTLSNYNKLDEYGHPLNSYQRYREDILRLNYHEHSILTSVQIIEFVDYIGERLSHWNEFKTTENKLKFLKAIKEEVDRFSKY
jgi:hypothetical protein